MELGIFMSELEEFEVSTRGSWKLQVPEQPSAQLSATVQAAVTHLWNITDTSQCPRHFLFTVTSLTVSDPAVQKEAGAAFPTVEAGWCGQLVVRTSGNQVLN